MHQQDGVKVHTHCAQPIHAHHCCMEREEIELMAPHGIGPKPYENLRWQPLGCAMYNRPNTANKLKERSAHMVKLCGDVSSKRAATSRANSSAISTLSFVGVSSSSTMISRAKASCATCWLHRWAINFRQPTAMPLSLRLKAFRNCRHTLVLGSEV